MLKWDTQVRLSGIEVWKATVWWIMYLSIYFCLCSALDHILLLHREAMSRETCQGLLQMVSAWNYASEAESDSV